MSDAEDEVAAVLRMLARERLVIDEPREGRTCFISHLGATPRLVPGAWIAHRELLFSLALANLTVAQRTSLAQALPLEHGREFRVGRLRLSTLASGLPLGGSSLVLEPLREGPRCLYTWALGPGAAAAPCDWLLLRAEPEWAADEPLEPLPVRGLATLAALGSGAAILVDAAVTARQVSEACRGDLGLAAHPRFSSHLEALDPEAHVLLSPHAVLDAAGLRGREVAVLVLVSPPEEVQNRARQWAGRQLASTGREPEVRAVGCPGRFDREALLAFWRACGRPKVLLRGDPRWTRTGARPLADAGATVVVQGRATQLPLL